MSVRSRITQLFAQTDWVLPVVIFILSMMGLAAIYSVDLSRGDSLTLFPVQTVAFGLGVIIFWVAASFHMRLYETYARLAYVVGFAALLGVLFFGVTIRGTTGWFRFAGFSFQPVELSKICLILFLAWLVSRYGRRFYTWQFVVGSALVTGIFVFLVLMQPDLGSALILIALWFSLLMLVRTRKIFVVSVVLTGVLVAAASWFFLLADYQKDRIRTFVNPTADPLTTGYNVNQSMIAIGSGKLLGRGLGFGSQSQLHFLPEAQTDFIFSVIAEELGFLAVSFVLFLYMLLLWRLIVIAGRCPDDFSSAVILGICAMLLVEIFLNIGATVGLVPVTGIPLPFLSYGGTALIMNFLLLGIAESIARSAKPNTASLA